MAPNPNPARITAAMWWLWEQLHALEPPDTALGGIYANKTGYHNTRAGNKPGNYCVVEPQDKRGPADKAAAIDWTFRSAQRGDYSVIAKYMARIMASGKDMNDERLNGWREFYGQADKDSRVEGWDSRYLREVTSDASHLWHIHMSESREHVESLANKDALLSVLKGESLAGVACPHQARPAQATCAQATGSRSHRLPAEAAGPGRDAGARAPTGPSLERGSTGPHVLFLQKMIGVDYASGPGVFGPKTEARVRWYQQHARHPRGRRRRAADLAADRQDVRRPHHPDRPQDATPGSGASAPASRPSSPRARCCSSPSRSSSTSWTARSPHTSTRYSLPLRS